MENNGEGRTIGFEMRKEITDESEIHAHYKLTLEDVHYRFEQWREEKINAYDKVLSGVSLRDRHPLKGTLSSNEIIRLEKNNFRKKVQYHCYQHLFWCRSFFILWCQSLLHQSPIRIKVLLK